MKKIGILYLCTGPYSLFWEDFYNSFEKNFLNNTEKYYFVFTDCEKNINTFNSSKVKVFYIDALPWPLITLLRFNYFLTIENELCEMDYLMFSNANIMCNENVNENEFLPRESEGEILSFVQHPGLYKRKKYNRPYERNKKSLAYIPYNLGKEYIIGAMFSGTREGFLKMSKTLKERIENDLKKNVIAKWHDESHINRYIIGHNDIRLLNPGFCYPVGFELNYPKKIIGVSKMAKFNVQKFKGTEEKKNGIKVFVAKICRRIKNEGVFYFIIDTIMMKKVDTIQ